MTGRALLASRPRGPRPSAVVRLHTALGGLLAACLLAGSLDAAAAAPVFEATPAREQPEENAPLLAPPAAGGESDTGQAPMDDPLVSEAGSEAGSGPDTAQESGAANASPRSERGRAARAKVGDATYRPPRFVDDESSSAPWGDVPADAAGVLFGQLQELRQELMMLRGVVESQHKTIEQLEREQRERYLDLDRRLSRLTGGSDAPQTDTEASGETGTGGNGAQDSGERAAYERAFALTREKNFSEAIPAFRNLIAQYPEGRYVPNAWYWLGELYLALSDPRLEQARQAFVQVERQFPAHRKVPDALYKLGVVHDRLGESDQAVSYLERVRDEHPESSAARLASNYLEQLQG